MSAPLPKPTAKPGTYALWFRIDEATEIAVGRRYRLQLEPGWAVYVGSAFGPGGTAARLAHHRRPVLRPHWHIDYLRAHARLVTTWISHDLHHRECLWAKVLATDLGGVSPPFRFGASDCHCPSHWFQFLERQSLAEFSAALQRRCPTHAPLLEQHA